ncbi:RNA-binding protein 12B-like [Bufo bufo]|uniref:RNA-binding protein 12B-like n=1 Tax=Bufo bufo TaxID=8384 RepID=UPI001ABE8856|nr:RNA-binding protein 12B-like [Bufo bufo]XP_040288008.1 RNA-binding protein 12B-like [Bufo bufo]
MSLIIRLQGLSAVADSFDIRQFFCGLNIPRGGVYITGGKYGEAYIVFATYEDARYALGLSGRPLKDSYVRLTYSNEEEMRRALELYQIGLKPSLGASNHPEVNSRGLGRPTFSYIYIHGMPIKVTKVELREFFRGLLVEDVLFLKFVNGVRNGNAIVKFGRSTDATEGLKLHNLALCGSPVTLKLSSELEWAKHGGENSAKRQRSPPPRFASYARRRTRTRSRSRSRSRSRTPVHRRRRRGSPYVREYFVHLINLSYRAEKKDIKRFFFDLDMKDSHINFLVDKEGKRTREGFAMFTTEKDYRRALSLNKETFKGHSVNILPISKRDMLGLIDRMKVRVCKDRSDRKKSPSRSSKEQKYLYLRNFPFNITKADVQKFFTEQTLKEDDITLLLDSKGVGLGEVLVKFADEKEASKAEKQNKQTYLGIKILLSRITEEQMKSLQTVNQADDDIVTEADDPDFTSDALPNLVTVADAPPEQTNGESPAPDSNEVDIPSESETVPPSDKEPEATPVSDSVQEDPMVQSELPEENLDDANGCVEEMPCEAEATKKSEVTLLFVRNLPSSVTAAEVLDFFHDYKVSSVNLKNIERGIASVRLPSYAEAESAINTLNKKEVGLKQVFLSLI